MRLQLPDTRKSRSGVASWIARSVVAALLLVGTAPEARGDSILAGSDYFDTIAASFDFGPPIGVVALTGRFGPGVTDTVVTRLQDAILPAVGSSDVIPIQMRLLALVSVAPVMIGGAPYDVSVSLDPAARSRGTMTINHEFPDNGTPAPEGTFTSSIQVRFLAEFEPLLTGTFFQIRSSAQLVTDPAACWSHEPPPGVLLVPGAPGDLDANLHAPLPAGFNDFFPCGVLEVHPGRGFHQAVLATQLCDPNDPACVLAPIPEPATLLLLSLGLAGAAGARYRQRVARGKCDHGRWPDTP
jgi:hypothetical protein